MPSAPIHFGWSAQSVVTCDTLGPTLQCGFLPTWMTRCNAACGWSFELLLQPPPRRFDANVTCCFQYSSALILAECALAWIPGKRVGGFDHPQVQPHFLHAMERSTPVERDESLLFSSSLGYFFFQTTLHHVFLENIPWSHALHGHASRCSNSSCIIKKTHTHSNSHLSACAYYRLWCFLYQLHIYNLKNMQCQTHDCF